MRELRTSGSVGASSGLRSGGPIPEAAVKDGLILPDFLIFQKVDRLIQNRKRMEPQAPSFRESFARNRPVTPPGGCRPFHARCLPRRRTSIPLVNNNAVESTEAGSGICEKVWLNSLTATE